MFTAFMVALTLTSTANVLVTLATGPLLTALAARLFIGHRLPLRTWLAIAAAGVGIGWMYGAQLGNGEWLGTLVALCVPIAGAANWTSVQHANAQGQRIDLVPAVLIGAVPPIMLATAAYPGGLPMAVFDGFRDAFKQNRAQFFLDVPSGPFYGFNREGAEVSEGLIRNWWRQGMAGGAKAQYDCITAFSENFYFMHGKVLAIENFPSFLNGIFYFYGRNIENSNVVNIDILRHLRRLAGDDPWAATVGESMSPREARTKAELLFIGVLGKVESP